MSAGDTWAWAFGVWLGKDDQVWKFGWKPERILGSNRSSSEDTLVKGFFLVVWLFSLQERFNISFPEDSEDSSPVFDTAKGSGNTNYFSLKKKTKNKNKNEKMAHNNGGFVQFLSKASCSTQSNNLHASLLSPSAVFYDGRLRLKNEAFSEDLTDPQSTRYKQVSDEICILVRDTALSAWLKNPPFADFASPFYVVESEKGFELSFKLWCEVKQPSRLPFVTKQQTSVLYVHAFPISTFPISAGVRVRK